METKTFLKVFMLTISGFLFLQFHSTAQENLTSGLNAVEAAPADTVKSVVADAEWIPTTAVYLELGGKVLYSLNVDFRRKESFAISAGVSYYKEEGDSETISQAVIFTSVMGYYLTGKRHRLELGGGLCPGFGTSEGLAAMAVYGNIGYRYQKKKGLIFRIGFTPFIGVPVSKDDDVSVLPWGAISLGYSF